MKKWGLIILLSGVTLAASAQETQKKSNYPYWTISKPVQRMQFKNVAYVSALAVTGKTLVSKGVQQVGKNRSPKHGEAVQMTGYPTWTISKGVARFQVEKPFKGS
jgi:hypothetical protein